MRSLEGKTAVITGGGSGIGRSVAYLFHSVGARVAIADMSGAEDDVARDLGKGALAIRGNVTSSADVERMFIETRDAFGGVDILINNAGIGGVSRLLVDDDESNIQRILDVNAKGAWMCMRAAAAYMPEQGESAIVNIASIAALQGYEGMTAYAASKAAVIGMTYAACRELGPRGIRVNAICPGPINTPLRHQMNPGAETVPNPDGRHRNALGRLGEPEEIAMAALFLASSDSSYITGAVLPVDGGQRA